VLFCGIGLIGRQRLQSALDMGIPPHKIFFFDPYLTEYSDLLALGINRISSLEDTVEIHPERVLIATPHHASVPLIKIFLDRNALVLAEKPMGRNLIESSDIISHKNIENLRIGFNYRHMPGIEKLVSLIKNNHFGAINKMRFQLGHGGAPEDLYSWKLQPGSAGGGALLDPGIHLLDLLLYLTYSNPNDFRIIGSGFWSGFWNTGVEEQFIGLTQLNNCLIEIDSSIVQWRTTFKIEIIGNDGYCILSGRGRSDGPQHIVIGKRWAWLSGKSQFDEEERYILSSSDDSIHLETKKWFQNDSSVASAQESFNAMVLENLFRTKAAEVQ
jgi:predicted dehydrogenase